MKPTRITPRLLRGWPLPTLAGDQGKRARGRVVVVGGSDEVPGAVVLAAVGALRAGAGTLQIATVRSAASHVAVSIPEARVVALRVDRAGQIAAVNRAALTQLADGCDTLLLGPGMRGPGPSPAVCSAIAELGTQPIVVLDAGALKDVRPGCEQLVLTPHAGEAATLLGIDRDEVEADPLAAARELARRHASVVALKGARTFVVAPDGRVFDNVAGNIGLGTSGSGDTLSGVIAGLCARGADPLQATVWGVHAHAAAGDRLARRIGPVGYLARELLAEIPQLIAGWRPRRRHGRSRSV